MIKLKIITILILWTSVLFSQDYSIYYITLSDKENNSYSINEPHEFLSERSLLRRNIQNLDIDDKDLPVSDFYTDSIIGFGAELIHSSKWLNLLLVKIYDADIISQLQDLSFTEEIVKIKEIDNRSIDKMLKDFTALIPKQSKDENYYDYGYSYLQIGIHNGQLLHNEGFRGQGMLIAITDTGFPGVDDESPFDSLRNADRIIAERNFVLPGQTIYSGNDHGSIVLSVLAGNTPEFLIGTAPEAEYILMVSEDVSSETIIEEINWSVAAEYADSLGVDIINVSLGYLNFDQPEFDYSYENMDGESSLIARAANIASQRGIIVVAAAGNSGEDEIHPYIVSPGDAKDVITVGALNPELEIAGFSSQGPSYDGRVKPDVVAIGSQTVIYQPYNGFVAGYGTSFATPAISGLIACLWQKYPEKTNHEIMNVLRE
jgi:serine protease AprX